MLYSCFNDRMRLYEVFEDDRGHAMNADLPVPSLPGEVNGIGVPSTEAGRPLPSDARRVGTSWLPRGIIVRCNVTPVRGIGALATESLSLSSLVAIVFAAGSFGWLIGRRR